jgi:hypothetical protein
LTVPMRRRDAWMPVLALGMSLAGCRAKSAPVDAVSVAPPEPEEPVPAKQPVCEEPDTVLLSVEPAQLSMTCKDGFLTCSGRATLTVHSCAARAFEFHEVWLGPGWAVGLGRTVRLAPGDTWTFEVELKYEGAYELSLGSIVMNEGDPPITLGTAKLTVDNPAREQAVMACRECNGEWGHHGRRWVGCVCRTRDGGTPCDDGDDCEGNCIDHGPETNFRCSEFVWDGGCYSYLPKGWSKERREGEEVGAGAHRICID